MKRSGEERETEEKEGRKALKRKERVESLMVRIDSKCKFKCEDNRNTVVSNVFEIIVPTVAHDSHW